MYMYMIKKRSNEPSGHNNNEQNVHSNNEKCCSCHPSQNPIIRALIDEIYRPMSRDLWSALTSPRTLEILFNIVLVLFSEKIGIHWPFKASRLNSVIFQFANVFLLLSYVSSNILWLRIVLTLACLCFAVWAGTFPPGSLLDTFMWNAVMMLINLRHAVALLFQLRPIQFDRVEHEQVYSHMFQGLISRKDFKILCDVCLVRQLRKVWLIQIFFKKIYLFDFDFDFDFFFLIKKKGRYYSQINDACSNLSILIKGKIQVVKAPQDYSEVRLKKSMDRRSVAHHAGGNGNHFVFSKHASDKAFSLRSGKPRFFFLPFFLKYSKAYYRSCQDTNQYSSSYMY
ncbi:Popeye domain-containing protein [Reticulomyxa filosa]|uniref:Popeye domain-containing protein n=1 Tax=Reticulomyxa filosa TaxID=46433 RepID=X6PE69_RETFI|nr:Popeye domain-containing protein [Reticulomyxa filosa]|eukprot:ETO36349.1 Popeye domain-containing protein [Reticulomyxa filosa]